MLVSRGEFEMTSGFVSCPFEECEFYGKLKYSEIAFFERHLASDHDFIELYQLAKKKEIVKDPFQYQSLSFLVRKISKLFIFRGTK